MVFVREVNLSFTRSFSRSVLYFVLMKDTIYHTQVVV